ncbi:VOC family protein [Promicromonospora citrea]|uniref:Glyoxalase n=1 Tax=Promicromonospora citrea TaxID=43677 RepID=A0A8H9L3Z3_9MICO|nr:VOC family protein [Promicromonospora citrea]NNH52849.1 VOC family protein [Promicromonospora citrea]GGM16624.1 glyoxalase [Promicromonospora citrea]
MVSFVSHVTVDCADAYSLAQWWKPVLGYQDVPGDPNLPGHEECMITDPEGKGVDVLFVQVPEGKSAKNRVHLDLRPRADLRDTEIERIAAHGATVVGDHRGIYGPGSGWVTFADPEGNEFCVLRSLEEVAAHERAAAAEPADT